MSDMSFSQSDFIHKYNDETAEHFNAELFERDDNEIIEYLKKVILSCQREKFFIIKVINFTVVEDYREITKILYDYEESITSKKKKENVYKYINLKDSDIKLLIIDYYIAAKDKSENIRVFLAVPRIVNKYYFRISGNIYSAMYQIVEGSTYNNSTSSNATSANVTFRSFHPIKMYKNSLILDNYNGEKIESNIYSARAFNKSVSACKYIFAKFGFYNTLGFMGARFISVTKEPTTEADYYSFIKNDIFINIPKYIFDNDTYSQSIVASIYKAINKDTKVEDIYTDTFWICSLGMEFNRSEPYNKGNALLDSIESIYDIVTKESIRLPIEQKETIYHILRWIMREFANLKVKDNLDIGFKRIRLGEYIASIYSTKILKSIYRITSMGKEIDVGAIKKAIQIQYNYLISQMSKSKLINYNDLVNSLDSITALKYSQTGDGTFGDDGSNNKTGIKKGIPEAYRYVHESHLGRLDLDSSSKSSPGTGGILCPTVDLYDKSFSDYIEPNMWEDEFSETVDIYQKMIGMKEAIQFKKKVLKYVDEDMEEERINESLKSADLLIEPIRFVINNDEDERVIPLTEDGAIELTM